MDLTNINKKKTAYLFLDIERFTNLFKIKGISSDFIKDYKKSINNPSLYLDLNLHPSLTKELIMLSENNEISYNNSDCFFNNIDVILNNLYPGSKRRRYKNVITLQLNSFYFRRFFEFIDFLENEENVSWNNFFLENHVDVYSFYQKGLVLFKDLLDNGVYNNNENILDFEKKTIFISKNKNDKLVLTILKKNNDIYEFYDILTQLIKFSQYVNVIGELYQSFGEIIEKEYLEQENTNIKYIEEGIPLLIEDMKKRIVNINNMPVRNDFEETVKVICLENNIDNILIPYNNFSSIVSDDLKELPVYIYKKKNEYGTYEIENNNDCIIVPISKEKYIIENTLPAGIFTINSFDSDLDEEDLAPHEIKEDGLVAVDVKIFLQSLVDLPEYGELKIHAENTLKLMNILCNKENGNNTKIVETIQMDDGAVLTKEVDIENNQLIKNNEFDYIAYILSSLINNIDISILKKENESILTSLYAMKNSEFDTLEKILTKKIPESSLYINKNNNPFYQEAVLGNGLEKEEKELFNYDFIHDLNTDSFYILDNETSKKIINFKVSNTILPNILKSQIKLFLESENITILNGLSFDIYKKDNENKFIFDTIHF